MTGLKKARLNKGNTNTLFDAYSEEEYEYDLAGNPYRYRVGSSDWNAVSSNKNNQTTQIDYASDAVLPIRGKASASATLNISVDGALQNYTRPSGQENFAFGLNAYTSTRKYQEVKAEVVETDNNTTPPATIRTMQRGKAYVEATPESFTYDANGNLLSDGRWNYTWDAENRLVEVETNLSAASAGVPQEKHVYVYDWMGRKVKSERYEYDGDAWMLVSTNKRYYDDYNLIYEATEYADGSSTEVRKYYYGTDLLGSVYGSAGTGGLRMMSINAEDLFALNNQVGSVEALFGANADTAAQVKAEYLYSAYGEVMMKSGDLAEKNNITYSTRYQESNTGLISYTYRHYSPGLKKWLSKDPIAEQGGINLYQMVANDPVGYWDMFGYFIPKKCSVHFYFGHASGKFKGEGETETTLQDQANLASKQNLSPTLYRQVGISCYASRVNNNNNKAKIGSFKGTDYKIPRFRNPFKLFITEWTIKRVTEKEIENAKSFADKNMCNKGPDCCKKISFKFFVITDASDSAYEVLKSVSDEYNGKYKEGYSCSFSN